MALLAFVAANPYSVLDFSAFQAGISTQASLAGGEDPVKLGTTAASGTAYYLWTYTWGLGWIPSLAALAGSVLLLVRRRLTLALVLLPAPIVFIIFMGDQQRFFGRWLMPTFPIVALLGGYAVVELVRWLIRSRRIPADPGVDGGRRCCCWPRAWSRWSTTTSSSRARTPATWPGPGWCATCPPAPRW